MRVVLYVSPHLDDVALSCAGALVTRAAAGERVVVATVFSSGAPRRVHASRRAEDRRALRTLGIEAVHLGFVDAPARLGVPASFRTLLLGAPPDRALVAAVSEALGALRRRLSPDEVWLPLGVGGHVDHLATFAAGSLLPGALRFYEDRPYAFSATLRRLRAMQLGGAPSASAPSPARVRVDLRAHGCGALAAEDEIASVAASLATRLARTPGAAPRWRSRTTMHRYRGDTARAAVRLIAAYERETRWLFGDADLLQLWSRLAPAGRGAFWERTTRLLRAAAPSRRIR